MTDRSPIGVALPMLAAGLIVLLASGLLLIVGKDVILPVLVASIGAYLLSSITDRLGKISPFRKWPERLRVAMVLILFAAAFVWLTREAIATGKGLEAELPQYTSNIDQMVAALSGKLGTDLGTRITAIWGQLADNKLLANLAGEALTATGSLGGTATIILLYIAFMLSERNAVARRFRYALSEERAALLAQTIGKINKSIADYVWVMTALNLVLGAASFLILLIFGVKFALFWAIMIGVLNFIPYLGAAIGLALPIIVQLAQTGSPEKTLLLAAGLLAAHTWVGSVLSPKLVGKKINMSPTVVLISLSVWTSVWGLAGAVLATPLTSILSIILANFQSTRWISIILAQDVPEQDKSTGSAAI